MNRYSLLVLIFTATTCHGSGGGGGFGGATDIQVEGGDDVQIMKVPKPVHFTCNLTTASGDLVPIDWFKDNTTLVPSERVVMEGQKLELTTTQESDVGQYKCQAKSDPKLYRYYDLVMLTYKNLPKSTTALEGDQFSLTCDAEGDPMPTVFWTKDDIPLDDAINGTRLEFRDSEKGVANATIILTEIEQSDRGVYMCNITNHHSLMYNTTTNVRVKDIYAALWPFLGIVIEVTILCIIIFIYEKRRTKQEFDESDNDTQANGTK